MNIISAKDAHAQTVKNREDNTDAIFTKAKNAIMAAIAGKSFTCTVREMNDEVKQYLQDQGYAVCKVTINSITPEIEWNILW